MRAGTGRGTEGKRKDRILKSSARQNRTASKKNLVLDGGGTSGSEKGRWGRRRKFRLSGKRGNKILSVGGWGRRVKLGTGKD